MGGAIDPNLSGEERGEKEKPSRVTETSSVLGEDVRMEQPSNSGVKRAEMCSSSSSDNSDSEVKADLKMSYFKVQKAKRSDDVTRHDPHQVGKVESRPRRRRQKKKQPADDGAARLPPDEDMRSESEEREEGTFPPPPRT